MFTQIVFLLLFFSLFWNFYPISPTIKKNQHHDPVWRVRFACVFCVNISQILFFCDFAPSPMCFHPRAFLSPVVDPENTKLIHSYESTHAKNCRGLIEKRAHTIDDFMRGKARLFSKTNQKKRLSKPNQNSNLKFASKTSKSL